MKIVSIALILSSIAFCGITGRAVAAAPPVACFNGHCDTQLDITHADITALLVGCDTAQSGDRVLVNERSQDGVLWTLLGVSPVEEKPINPDMRRMVTSLQRPIPTTYPEVRFRLKPGYYSALTVSVGDCNFGPLPLTTAGASSDRHIILIRQPTSSLPAVDASATGGAYGYAPLPGLQITLTGGSPQQTVVARDEVDPNPLSPLHGEIYMYFFDSVAPGQYSMTVSGFGWAKGLGNVEVSRAGDVVLRYIHGNELGLTGK
ncbi:MAG: hypothetical protein WB615_06720 [Candidatus Tumulicola sp.]